MYVPSPHVNPISAYFGTARNPLASEQRTSALSPKPCEPNLQNQRDGASGIYSRAFSIIPPMQYICVVSGVQRAP